MRLPDLLAVTLPGGIVPEDILLWAALLTGVAGFLAMAFYVRGQGAVHLERAERLAQVTAGLLVINLLLMLAYFVTTALRIEYVHSYTEVGAPLAYRIAGLWGGQKGTVLMWGTFAAIALVANQTLWNRRARRGLAPPIFPASARAWTLLIGLGVVVAFVLLMIIGKTWERTDAYLLDLRPNGVGLQPVLRTPFMVIHPPLQFVGYALAVLLYSSGLAFLVTKDKHWADVALPWTRLAFLVQFVGLGLGGLWAYYVLNFGGYWAWDPVETANLIALFPTILLLHALMYYRKRGMFPASAPLYAVLTFVATLFSTIATRSGLWVSVHAFTDPSKNFARDPLQRFLNILEASGPLLSALVSLFLAAIFAAVLAYLWRTGRDAAGPGQPRWTLRFATACLFLVASFLALGVLDPKFATSLLFQASHQVFPSNSALGLALVLFGTSVVFASPALFQRETARDEAPHPLPWKDRWITTPNLVFLGMTFVALAWLVTFLLDILSVNGYQRAVYDDRAPLVALPILLLLGLALGHPTWGKDRSLFLGGAALAAGILLAIVFPNEWDWLLPLPLLLYALAGAAVKLFKVSDRGREHPFRLRVAGAILLFGGAAALAYWANPPTRIPFGFTDAYPGPWWVLLGFPAGLLAIFGGASTLRGSNYRLALLGGVGLTLSLAWLVAVPLGVAALALVRRERAGFECGRDDWACARTYHDLQRRFRKSGTYLIHVFLVLGLLGYATSTYLQPEEAVLTLAPGGTATAHGYTYAFAQTSTTGMDPDEGILRDLTAEIDVVRGGRVLHTAPLTMWLELRDHYAERVQVERYWNEDVYLRPVRFTVQQGGDTVTFNAHDDNIRLHSGAEITQVVFTAKPLPGMHLVWAGLWGVATGILIVLSFGGFRFEAKGYGKDASKG